MATADFVKDLKDSHLRIVGGTTTDPLTAEIQTWTWTADGGSIMLDGAIPQPHPPSGKTLKTGTTVVVDKKNKTVTIREVT